MRRVPLGNTHYFKFTSRNFSTGVPFTLGGTPVISVYEENNATPITAGVTLSADYGSVTGLNSVAVVASGANGYEVGKTYAAVITTGTVNSVSVVGEVVDQFEVVPAENAAGYPLVDVYSVGGTAQTANDNGADINTLLTRIIGTLAAGTHNPASAAQIAVLSDLIDGGRLDLILDELTTQGDTNEIKLDTLTTNLATVDGIVDNLNLGIIYGTAQTGTLSTTQATTDLAGYSDDQLIGRVIIWTSGNCDGEGTDITDYASASGLITFTALTTAPANGDTFKIV